MIVWAASALFSIGLYGILSRRDLVAILASAEVMLTGVTVFLVGATSGGGQGQVTALAFIVIAAAEAVVGIALVLASVRRTGRERVDELTEVKG